jgi:hypothetical protein
MRCQQQPSVAGLAFFCPCCKESRSMATHNPFDDFHKHGHKNPKKEKKKKKLKRLTSSLAEPVRRGEEATASTAEGLARELGFSPEDVDRAGFRVHHNPSASVSWSDCCEMRRLILKDVLLHAALEPLLVLQCAARCWRARARVQRARREAALRATKKKKKKSRGSSINTLEPEVH